MMLLLRCLSLLFRRSGGGCTVCPAARATFATLAMAVACRTFEAGYLRGGAK